MFYALFYLGLFLLDAPLWAFVVATLLFIMM